MKKLLIIAAFFLVSSFNLFGGWTLQESGVSGTLHDVHFVDNLHGWIAAGGGGTILRTTNGGKNWEVTYINSDYSLHSIGFIDSLKGWVGGNRYERVPPASYYYWAILLHTNDGGRTWGKSKEKSLTPLEQIEDVTDIDIIDYTHGFYTSYSFEARMFSRGNAHACLIGGGAWGSPSYSFYPPSSKSCFIDTLHGWVMVVHDNTKLFYTAKGVESLSVICELPINKKGCDDIDFVDILHGWIVGDSSIIYHTEDGGTTWVEQTSGVTSSLRVIDFLDSLNGWVAGDKGVILRTRNGGNNWIKESTPISSDINSICFVDTAHGWAVGDSGKILHYTTYGVEESEKLKMKDVKLMVEPNPCRNHAIINYELPVRSKVSLKIYNVVGRVVKVLVDEEVLSGYHKIEWNAEKFPSGIYFASLVAPNCKTSKKLILTR